jgi:hypothetical protein
VILFGGTRELRFEMNWCTAIRNCDGDILECIFKHFCKKEIHFYQTIIRIECIEIILGAVNPLVSIGIKRVKRGACP